MVDDKDSQLSALYRAASRGVPPASVDRAIAELARKPVHKRTLAAFGNHWVAATVLAGIWIVSVLLVVLLQEQAGVLDVPRSLQDADAPLTASRRESLQLMSAADEAALGVERNADARPEPAGERFDFYSTLPEAGQEIPTERRGIIPAVPPQLETGQAVKFVLQIEGFHNPADAETMQDKLDFMRLDSRIRQDDTTPGSYLIRIGPYTNLNELGRVEALLSKRGIRITRQPLP